MNEDRSIVAPAGVRERAVDRIKDHVENRHEHHRGVVIGEKVVDVGERLTGISDADRRPFQQRPCGHHEQSCGNPLARHVRNGEPDTAPVEEDEIVEVAADSPGVLHVRVQLVAGARRKVSREDRALHLPGYLKLVLQLDQLLPSLNGLAPLDEIVQRPINRQAQVGEIDGFGDEVESPPVHRTANVADVAVGGDDHGPDVRSNRYPLQQFESVHAGHVDIRNHQVEGFGPGQDLQRLNAVPGERHGISPGADLMPHPLPDEPFQVRFVVHYENSVRTLWHGRYTDWRTLSSARRTQEVLAVGEAPN